jgi:hypothetical protein
VKHRAATVFVTTAAVVLAGTPATAQTTPPGPAPSAASAPWNASTAPPPTAPAADDSALSLRVYDSLNSRGLLPYRPRGPDDPAYAVDVSAIMSRCSDGRLVVSALLIGGHLTPLDNRCSAAAGGKPGIPEPACDARTWTCTTRPPE